jgi:hypothetical protein
VPGNARRGRPQGKCHREQTAKPGNRQARVKGCGKSAPRTRQRERHGKPHREQDQVGTAAGQPAGGFSASPSGSVARGAWRQASQRNGHPLPPLSDRDRTRLTGRLAPIFLAAAPDGDAAGDDGYGFDGKGFFKPRGRHHRPFSFVPECRDSMPSSTRTLPEHNRNNRQVSANGKVFLPFTLNHTVRDCRKVVSDAVIDLGASWFIHGFTGPNH